MLKGCEGYLVFMCVDVLYLIGSIKQGSTNREGSSYSEDSELRIKLQVGSSLFIMFTCIAICLLDSSYFNLGNFR